jgi:hypothetical protein
VRKIIDLQTKIGQPTISDIKFDLSSRDEIPQLLMGLQAIYSNSVSKKAIIEALKEKLGKNIVFHNGRLEWICGKYWFWAQFGFVATGILTKFMRWPTTI